jgi:transposase
MICAGIDTGKHKLDVALHERNDRLQVRNNPDGHGKLVTWLRERGVTRVGIEASGGYERDVVVVLRRTGFEVVVFQPGQVRAYATFHLQLAKNDTLDADLIADCTADVKKIHAPPDPRLAPLAERLTVIDQISEDIARCKTRLETCPDQYSKDHWKAQIALLEKAERAQLRALEKLIREHGDLSERLDLIESVDGIGIKTAIVILVRIPEIGHLTREEIGALVGLAPYVDESGTRRGDRHIWGGRKRVRRGLYTAALPAAMFHNKHVKELYRRMTAAGKEHKVALVACARKLVVFANAVVARGKPWETEYAH